MSAFTDSRLSLEARGAYGYLLDTRPERITGEHVRQAGCGRDQAYRILGELTRAGYLKRTSFGYAFSVVPDFQLLTVPENQVLTNDTSPGEYATGILETSNSQPMNYAFSVVPENQVLTTTAYIESYDHDLSAVVVNDGFPENQVLTEVNGQQTLVGLSEQPTPVPAPPSQAKPKRPRPPAPPAEAKALYGPMFDLTKRPRSGKSAMGVYTKCAALWREFQATPEQVTAFWLWFKEFSRPAQIAAREQRPLNAPLPKQVHEDWPAFLPWWQARQDEIARQAQRRRREQPVGSSATAGDPDAPLRDRKRIEALNPFRNRLRKPAVLAAD